MSVESKSKELLLKEFDQSWEHFRHVEEQRWKVIEIFFALTAGLVTLVSALYTEGLVPQDIFVVMLFIVAVQGVLSIQVIMKLRLEFCLHFTNVNRIRKFFAKSGHDITKETDVFVGSELVPFFKPTSVHLGTIIPVGITTAIMCVLIPYFYIKSYFQINLNPLLTVNMFLIAFVILWSFIVCLGTKYDSKYADQTKKYRGRGSVEKPSTKIRLWLFAISFLSLFLLILNILLISNVGLGTPLSSKILFETEYAGLESANGIAVRLIIQALDILTAFL